MKRHKGIHRKIMSMFKLQLHEINRYGMLASDRCQELVVLLARPAKLNTEEELALVLRPLHAPPRILAEFLEHKDWYLNCFDWLIRVLEGAKLFDVSEVWLIRFEPAVWLIRLKISLTKNNFGRENFFRSTYPNSHFSQFDLDRGAVYMILLAIVLSACQ